MIKSVYLENWRSHHRSTLEFSKGTNVIVGKSGAGKSSVMDAISFALYGTFPGREARRVSLEETIMSKPMKQDRAVVRVEFDYNGKDYTAERTVKRSGINEGELREGGRLIAGPKTSDVTKKISEILEVPYDLFSRAIYSEQNQIDYFLRLSPAQRKEKFDELLGLDRYESARTNAVTLANRVKKNAEDRKGFLAEQKKKNDPKELAELERRLAEKEKETAAKSAELEKAENDSSEKGAEVKALEEKEREHRLLRDAELRLKSRLDSAAEETARMRKKLGGADPAKIASGLEKARKKLKETEESRKAAEKELRTHEKALASLREKLAAQKNAEGTIMKSLANAKGMGAECPVCRRPVSGHDRGKLEKELGDEKEKIEALRAETEKLIGKAGNVISAAEKKLSEEEKENDAASEECETLERLAEISADILEKEKTLKEIEKGLKKAAETLAAAKFDEKGLNEARGAFQSLREKAAKARAEVSSGKELLKELGAGVKRMKELGAQITAMEKEAAELEKAGEKLSVFTSALVSTQGELRNVMIETINEAMDEIWQKIYPYGDYTSCRIMVDEGSYEIMVKQLNGEWARVEGILSGGERSSVALTMRIAVSLVLTQNLGWIILDEPTHNLDANSVKGLSETMRTHLPEIIGQVFIITHDKEMEYAASGKLYVLEREKEKDGATRIENGA